ncbi:hypothetical protein [Flavobacterium sp. 3HN19-14]|uniref:hypothetical protein n=1 Tax=Flavobacterium sp. 3HN19-14 TaxID=3448133 RepID=UPI003EE1823B
MTFNDIIASFHPDDVDFIVKVEAALGQFFHKNVEPANLMKYKSSFNFRIKTKDGTYALFNHQAMMLTLGADGGLGKAINIHTRIDHLTEINNYRFSLIGTDNAPSFLNLSLDEEVGKAPGFPKKNLKSSS